MIGVGFFKVLDIRKIILCNFRYLTLYPITSISPMYHQFFLKAYTNLIVNALNHHEAIGHRACI